MFCCWPQVLLNGGSTVQHFWRSSHCSRQHLTLKLYVSVYLPTCYCTVHSTFFSAYPPPPPLVTKPRSVGSPARFVSHYHKHFYCKGPWRHAERPAWRSRERERERGREQGEREKERHHLMYLSKFFAWQTVSPPPSLPLSLFLRQHEFGMRPSWA